VIAAVIVAVERLRFAHSWLTKAKIDSTQSQNETKSFDRRN
jgi:hypothetical protein